MKLLKLNKQGIITIIFILFCLAGYIYFPAVGAFQYKAVSVIFLVLLPFLYDKYFLKENNFFKNFSIGSWKKNIQWVGAGLTLAFFLIALVFVFTDLSKHYFLSSVVKKDFWQFLWYELLGVSFSVAMYELFFRGFVMRYFTKTAGKWAILIQFLFFVLMILTLNLPYWFYINFLIFAPIAGWIAYKSESILYSFASQWLFIIIVDTVFIAFQK